MRNKVNSRIKLNENPAEKAENGVLEGTIRFEISTEDFLIPLEAQLDMADGIKSHI